ncbi:MAG: hypothetical protein BGO69_15780 [Bacteroidetes bacterium 46-16]|nr:MAG: hypothetical protein BGO69_15780 [Bacteroidetes bacterium 46-16]
MEFRKELLADINVENRIPILRMALLMEAQISDLIANLLGMEDYKTAKSLNKSSSLSFNQKIMLLIDIGALDKEAQTIFTKFMEIRNVFMHDIWADTYEKCVAKIDGLEKWLLKTYEQDKNLPKELQLRSAIESLCSAVIGNTLRIVELVIERSVGNDPMKAINAYMKGDALKDVANHLDCVSKTIK